LRIVQESRTIHEMRASSSVYDVEKYNCSWNLFVLFHIIKKTKPVLKRSVSSVCGPPHKILFVRLV
jgi:hypothetical protein